MIKDMFPAKSEPNFKLLHTLTHTPTSFKSGQELIQPVIYQQSQQSAFRNNGFTDKHKPLCPLRGKRHFLTELKGKKMTHE